jgi:hypothetical protein
VAAGRTPSNQRQAGGLEHNRIPILAGEEETNLFPDGNLFCVLDIKSLQESGLWTAVEMWEL